MNAYLAKPQSLLLMALLGVASQVEAQTSASPPSAAAGRTVVVASASSSGYKKPAGANSLLHLTLFQGRGNPFIKPQPAVQPPHTAVDTRFGAAGPLTTVLAVTIYGGVLGWTVLLLALGLQGVMSAPLARFYKPSGGGRWFFSPPAAPPTASPGMGAPLPRPT